MQTLGVYGDSFAATYGAPQAWGSILKKDYNVTNYAVGGSDIYFSYKNFIKTHHLYDKIIFVVTDASRYWNSVYNINGKQYAFNCRGSIENVRVKEINIPPEMNLKITALDYYYTHLIDCSVHDDIASLMVEKIRTCRPDAIVVNIHSYKNIYMGFKDNVGFFDYQELFVKSVDPEKLKMHVDSNTGLWKPIWLYFKEKNLYCHMSEEVNELVAQHMKEALEKGIWNPVLPNILPHYHGWDYYYDLA